MSIAFLLATLVVVGTPGTGAVYSIGPGPVPWLQGRHRRRVRLYPRRRPAHGGGDHRARRDPARLGDRVPGNQVARNAYLLYFAWQTLQDQSAIQVEDNRAPLRRTP
jgi:hypothetical protein